MNWIVWHAWKESGPWGFWFRVHGYGLSISTNDKSFSERNGYKKSLVVFGIKISILKPFRLPTGTEILNAQANHIAPLDDSGTGQGNVPK